MIAPLSAGSAGAWLHWHEHCTVAQTRYTPEADLPAYYRAALDQGATGFREVLPSGSTWRREDLPRGGPRLVRSSAGH
ncbi:hypothetical protein [Paracoccus chinensis]|uniref:Uncharacterized protein n=1 Tax=Paracoccus chinensis TaxID=525640 RepID=A0A1G9IZU0_9RHOB|nr:hypothetical protein [Paracoccus chinensis]SDL30546.1 hypothetical protein SAMN04487971_108194 [Paracoccus chinensis]